MNIPSATVRELREYLCGERDRLLRRDPARQGGRAWMDEYTAVIDETLRRIFACAWELARTALGQTAPSADSDPGVALLAIGGYGRGQLCPHSDIDIAFIPAEEENPLIDLVVKEAFRLVVEVMIDGARLDVSYAYRPIADVERLDDQARTALLEARRIAGSEHLLQELQEELYLKWDAVDFMLEKVKERRATARRLPLSLYAIEPHLKDGTGALREIQTVSWVAGAVLKTVQPLRELEWRGVVTAGECQDMLQARDFMLRLRIWLHLVSGKKTDVLRIEWQDRAAQDLGYKGKGGTAAQELLADYYRHAGCAARFSQKIMRRLLEGPLPLDGHFTASHQHLSVAHPHALRNHPELVMTPFVLAHKYGFTTGSDLDLSIEDALPLITEETRIHPIMRLGFHSLMSNVGEAADVLIELRARGVLQAFMPEFANMLLLAPGDPSHQLTVGEHSIYAVRKLGDLWRRRGEDEIHSVWEGVDDPELLVLATLLHDIGKIEPTGDHAVTGARLSLQIGLRLGLTKERSQRLALLVRLHLLFPRVARLRDLAAPATIQDVVKKAKEVSNLKMLYLLSLADTCAVGERTYSNLELDAMRELYGRALLAMTRKEMAQVLTDSEQREQMAQRERERIRRQMKHLALDDATLQRLCDDLPPSYVLNTRLETIATHLKFLEQLPGEELIVDSYADPTGAYNELTIIAYDDDKPGLLSKICGVVHAAGAEILTAQVFTLRGRAIDPAGRQADIVLDQLNVTTKGRALSESQSSRLAALLRQVLLGHESVDSALQNAGKRSQQEISPQKVSARNDLSDEHSVVSVVSDSVPGLLFYVTRALAAIGLDIHTAKITTWAGRAEDAFYVTRRGADGRDEKLSDDAIAPLLEALREKLQNPDQLTLTIEG